MRRAERRAAPKPARASRETRLAFVPSMPAQAGMEPRHSALQAAALRDATPLRGVHARTGGHGAAPLSPSGGRRAAPWGQS